MFPKQTTIIILTHSLSVLPEILPNVFHVRPYWQNMSTRQSYTTPPLGNPGYIGSSDSNEYNNINTNE